MEGYPEGSEKGTLDLHVNSNITLLITLLKNIILFYININDGMSTVVLPFKKSMRQTSHHT
jgi:hypothetical protein